MQALVLEVGPPGQEVASDQILLWGDSYKLQLK